MKMNRKIVTIVLLAVLVSALIPIPAFAAVINVTTDKTSYIPGELVTVSGDADANSWVTIEIKDPDDARLSLAQVQADPLGDYELPYGLLVDAMLGEYTVYASAGIVVSTTFIVALPGENIDPVADAGEDCSGETGVELDFDGSGSYDVDGNIVSWVWNFDDGGTWPGETTPHEFAAAGEYTVTLTVTDDEGATDSDTVIATITEADAPPDDDDDEEPEVTPGEGFTIDLIWPTGDVDYDDTLTVYGSGVTAGSEVIAYWDYAGGTLVHPLNNTEGNPDGSFDLEITVPSDVVGNHYLWVKDVATGSTVKSDAVTMIPKIKLSPSSGLENDDITIKGYGFADESEIDITFDPTWLSDDGGTDVDETDDWGYFEYTFEVDTDADDDYLVTATDEDNNDASATFKLGAAISIDPDEGPTGTVVEVEGRGWIPGETITFREETSLMAIEVVDSDVITVSSNGRFSAEIVIPELGNEGDYDIEAVGSITTTTSTDGFELTGLPEIVVTPTYGTPGATITVTGYNFTQIAGTEVTITIDSTDLVIAETNSDGTFEDTFTSPAVVFQTYDVNAVDEYFIAADDPFKVGLIALIINPVYGEAGTELFITGIGFADGDYNVTFGIKLYEEYGSGIDDEALSDYFFVPNVVPGPYDIIISDTDGNEMTIEFRVTAVTEVTLDPTMAPNKYNVTVEGCNFADYEDTVDFVLYNATDEWDMAVRQGSSTVNTAVKTDDDGNFTAWWEVLDEDTLSLGDYTINVTGYDDFFVQVPFSIVEARVSVAPRKPLFDRGDSIQFDVKNDFDFDESYMKIWDPDDNLYWETREFTDWVKSGDLYTVPYYMQTSGGNPMELTQDAPLGTWVYVFYETGTTQLTNGTFEVGPSAESLLTEQITALSEELGIDIDTLRTVIDDLGIDMDEAVSMMAEDIAAAVSGMESEIAGLSEDLDDAVTGMQDDLNTMGDQMTDIDTMIDNLADSTTNAQQAANDAKISADQATEAAEANQQQTSGLTGLVYGAIGASLIAALAAIVSLMQISRRIAG